MGPRVRIARSSSRAGPLTPTLIGDVAETQSLSLKFIRRLADSDCPTSPRQSRLSDLNRGPTVYPDVLFCLTWSRG